VTNGGVLSDTMRCCALNVLEIDRWRQAAAGAGTGAGAGAGAGAGEGEGRGARAREFIQRGRR